MKARVKKIPIIREGVDTDSGEIREVEDFLEITVFDLGNWFKMMVVDHEVEIKPLESLGKQFVVFYFLLQRTIWQDCTVDIGHVCKSAIGEYLKLKPAMIMKYIKHFCAGKLMKKISGNGYMINPRFFYIGDKETQIKLLKKYNEYGKRF